MAKGKYAHIVSSLPRSFGSIDEDPSSSEKVAAVKAAILQPVTEEEAKKDELTSEAIEDLVMEVSAMLKVINDGLIRGVAKRMNAGTVAKMYRDIRKVKNAMDEQEKTLNIIKAAYEQVLVDQYEAEGMTNLSLDDYIGGAVRYELQPHGAVKDKDANREWAMKSGLERSLSLPWQTINALTKQALLDGLDPPDGVEVTARVKVVYTK